MSSKGKNWEKCEVKKNIFYKVTKADKLEKV